MRRTRSAELAAAVALAAAAWTGAARAQGDVPGAGGALAIAADPPRLVLGSDGGAELRIAAPPEVLELSMTASAGRIEGLRRLPGGGFAARYQPPPERHPQVAIVTAVGRAGAAVLDGWLAVPLAGRGDARVRGAPGAEVSLRIGERTFGPARAGPDGVANLPVIVPPGVREGHQGFTAVDLRVPETTLVHGALERATAAADRPEAIRFFAYVIAPHGAARGGEAPRVEPTRGTAALRAREPGAFEGTWTVPPGPAGEERLAIRLEGFPASRVTLRLTTLPGPAAAVAVALDRAALVAGKGEDVVVTGRALDAVGNPTAAPVVLAADWGTLQQEDAGPGAVRGVLHVAPGFEGRTRVLVRGRVQEGAAAGEAALQLQAGPPARAELSPEVTYAFGDEASEAVLSLALRDAWGNPAPDTPKVTAGDGLAARVTPGEPGRWEVRIRGGAVRGVTRTRVEAEAGDARGGAELWLLPPRSRQLALLGGVGALLPVGGARVGGQLLVGAELPAPQLLSLAPERALGVRLELVIGDRDRRAGTAARAGTTAALLAGPVLKGLFRSGQWYAAGTAGLALGTGGRPGGGAHTGLAPALRLAVGVSAPVRRTAPFLELGFLAAGGTPAGAFSAFTLSVGVRHDWARAAAARKE